MNNILQYAFEEHEIRIIDQAGNPWFVVRDLLTAMKSTTKVHDAVESIKQGLGDEVVNDSPIQDSLGREQIVSITAESGATYLLSRSNTEEGRRLNRFVHKEVLPSIRKTGSYNIRQMNAQQFNNPVLQIVHQVMMEVDKIEQRTIALEDKAQVVEQKADYLNGRQNRLVDATRSIYKSINDKTNNVASKVEVLEGLLSHRDPRKQFTATDIATRLNMSTQKFNAILEKAGYIKRVPNYKGWTSGWILQDCGRSFATQKKMVLNRSAKSPAVYPIQYSELVIDKVREIVSSGVIH